MKKLWKKFKNWLILALGGITSEGAVKLIDASYTAHINCLKPWKSVVQELCRKSDNTYYDWCCEYCDRVCDKHNGWCEKFAPRIGANNERHC